MTRFLAWVVVVLCLLLWAAPAAAQSAPEAPGACAIEEGGYRGLSASDLFPAGQIALTFDDGPQPLPTRRLLDLLERHHYRATFFIVGLWIRPDTYQLIQRMVAAGHELGTHTYSHDEYLTRRNWGVDYIEGQYRLTHVLVELALLSSSADEFKVLYGRVFGRTFAQPNLSPEQVRTSWRGIEQNHLDLLAERGYDAEHRVYPMLYARPPGGMPYMGRWPAWMRQQHEQAMRRLGMVTVLWHGISGDTVEGRSDDVAFLLANVRYHTRRGGILLMHDRMRHDAMAQALSQIARDPKLEVVTLSSAVTRKYACQAPELYAALHPPPPKPARVAATSP